VADAEGSKDETARNRKRKQRAETEMDTNEEELVVQSGIH
jgi:hypothetical protein